MLVKVTSRHIELPRMAEEMLRTKVQKLERFGHKLNSVHAILGKEKYLFTAELAVSMKGAKLVGKAKHPKDLLTCMEDALAKVILQLKRKEDKKRVEKRRRVPRRPG